MRTIGETMTRQVLSVHPDAPFKQVASVLVDHHVHAVPVVDEHGELLGMVSESDLTCHEEPDLTFTGLLKDGRTALSRARKARARTARELMSCPARTITPDSGVCEALRVMHRARVGRLPVVERGRLVGIVTRSDLLKIFTRSDEELQAEVEAAVRTALRGADADLRLTVADGIAFLRGHVARASQAVAAGDAARGVAGIVDVEDELHAEVDDLDVLTGYAAV